MSDIDKDLHIESKQIHPKDGEIDTRNQEKEKKKKKKKKKNKEQNPNLDVPEDAQAQIKNIRKRTHQIFLTSELQEKGHKRIKFTLHKKSFHPKKLKAPRKETLERWFGDNILDENFELDTHTSGVFRIKCKACFVILKPKLSILKQHMFSQRHISKITKNSKPIDQEISPEMEITRHLLSSGIPIEKVKYLITKEFVNALKNLRSIPSISNLRSKIQEVKKDHEMKIQNIFHSPENQNFVVILDETSDLCRRSLVSIIFKTFFHSEVVCLTEVQKTDSLTLYHLLETTLKRYKLNWNQIRALITDGASYCKKLGVNLKQKLSNFEHILCGAHLIHLIANNLMKSFSNINNLIVNVNSFFQKGSQSRRRKKWIELVGVLIPRPVKTRWGTWVKTASSICKYQKELKQFVREESESEYAKKIFEALDRLDTIEQLDIVVKLGEQIISLIPKLQEKEISRSTFYELIVLGKIIFKGDIQKLLDKLELKVIFTSTKRCLNSFLLQVKSKKIDFQNY